LRASQAETQRFKKEIDNLKMKNSANLQQTQEGIKTFKDEIDSLKSELQREKTKLREMKLENDQILSSNKENGSKLEIAENRVKDLEDKWAKSKRINQQRKEKIEALEKQLEKEKGNGSNGGECS